ncbi:hypothetical protein ABZ357_23070 [Streptomyces sp. NPDC005917]
MTPIQRPRRRRLPRITAALAPALLAVLVPPAPPSLRCDLYTYLHVRHP